MRNVNSKKLGFKTKTIIINPMKFKQVYGHNYWVWNPTQTQKLFIFWFFIYAIQFLTVKTSLLERLCVFLNVIGRSRT